MLKTLIENFKDLLEILWFYFKLLFSLFLMYYVIKTNLLYTTEEVLFLEDVNLMKTNILQQENLEIINIENNINKGNIKKKDHNDDLKNVQNIIKNKEDVKKISLIILGLVLFKITYQYFSK